MRTTLSALLAAALAGCGTPAVEGDPSEVSVSAVSGALANGAGSALGLRTPWGRPRPTLERMWDDVVNAGTALAASWKCTGGLLAPSYDGPQGDPYAWTPASCSVTWGNGKTAASSWSESFTESYGSSCDARNANLALQVANCSVTRTTATGGNTRTLTGPDGNSYAMTDDTHGTGTGWDSTVTPAPNDQGVIAACSEGGCAVGGTLALNGSHLTGTLTDAKGASTTIWDHTLTTGASPLTVTRSSSGVTVTGSVTVQHNLLHETGTTTFAGVVWGDPLCCFPTSGSVATAFVNGPNAGKSETLTFGSSCGEDTLTTAGGSKVPLTLMHCL